MNPTLLAWLVAAASAATCWAAYRHVVRVCDAYPPDYEALDQEPL